MSSLASDATPDTQSTGDTSSCDLDSDTETPSSPTSSFGIASPRQDPPAGAPRTSPVPKLGLSIPRLDLGSGGAGPPVETASRGVGAPPMLKPGPLNLGNLQRDTNSPMTSKQPASGRSKTTQLAVELLSPAFKIEVDTAGAGSSDITNLQVQCAGKFGVRQDRVQLYALMPISNTNYIPDGCENVAVHVHGSDFSLQAIEEVLSENQKLKSLAPPLLTSNLASTNSSSELELLKQEVARLRQRLTSSEMLRHRGQQALQELKEEFETLHFDLLQHTDNVLSARTPRPALELTAGGTGQD
ncbi:hypothetical protein Ndes2526B_g02982 [Nannochloris sp. 'desiccata']